VKVVINDSVGGFGLSRAAVERMAELGSPEATKMIEMRARWAKEDGPIGESYRPGGMGDDHWCMPKLRRDDPILIRVIEEMGPAAAGASTRLKVLDIPDGIQWDVHEGDDGREWVAERHRTWG
jgi:hypothetical protein